MLSLLFIFLFTAIFFLCFPLIVGAPFVPSHDKTIEKMIRLGGIRAGHKAVDLGAGDGRLLVALARAGAEARGYEINPLLVWIAKRKIEKAGVSRNARVYFKNFWNVNLSEFDAITVFGARHIMKKLQKKFEAELRPGTRIAVNAYPLPDWRPVAREGGMYVYEKGISENVKSLVS